VNSTVNAGSDNHQNTSQTQNMAALATGGTQQSQTAQNAVVGGSDNDQHINQTQTLIVLP